MRRQKRGFSMNLDSLMDTMTNVVGILIILLAVTQLSVGHTIKQIRFKTGSSGVSEKEFERAQKDLTELRSERDKLERELAEYRSGITQMDRTREQSRQLAELHRRAEATGEKKLPNEQTLAAEIASLEKRIADLNEKIAAKEEEIETKRSALAAAYKQGPEMTDVRIPVLTPAPSGLEPVCFICRKGRVYPFDVESLGKKFMEISREITGQRTGNIRVGAGELRKIIAYLDEHDIGDEYIRLKVEDLSVAALLRFEPRRLDQGETVEQLSARNSVYTRKLRSVDPKKQSLKFFVWSDSFETYTSAKDVANRMDEALHGKWIPLDKDVELREVLGGPPTQDNANGGGEDWLF